MKICPICHEEVEDSFEICWNCNYSFPEGAIIELPEGEDGGRSLDCLRCHTHMLYSGSYKFHEGFETGILGSLFEIFQNKETFDLYVCPRCGKVEFFSPLK